MKILWKAAIIALFLQLVYTSYVFNCTGEGGTQAFLSGSYAGRYAICKYYDYSKHFSSELRPIVREIQAKR